MISFDGMPSRRQSLRYTSQALMTATVTVCQNRYKYHRLDRRGNLYWTMNASSRSTPPIESTIAGRSISQNDLFALSQRRTFCKGSGPTNVEASVTERLSNQRTATTFGSVSTLESKLPLPCFDKVLSSFS